METSIYQQIYEQFLQSNTLNFIIVVWTLGFIFKKAHLGDLIQKLADEIKDSVEESYENVENAKKNLEETKVATSGTEELREKIIKQGKISAEAIKNKIEEDTKLRVADIKANVERAFEDQEENIKNLTIDEIYSASVELAKEEVLKRLDKDVHKRLINSSIDELCNVEGNLS